MKEPRRKLWALFLLPFFFVSVLQAETESEAGATGREPASERSNVIDMTIQASSSQQNMSSARQEIMDKAAREAAETVIRDLLGESRMTRHRRLINSEVLANTSRFVPTLRVGDLRRSGSDFVSSVRVQISVSNLESLLLEHGLLYDMEGAPLVLPMVGFLDRVNSQTYRWWLEESPQQKAFLHRQSGSVERALQKAFFDMNFAAVQPSSFQMGSLVPVPFRAENLRTEDYQNLAQALTASIVVHGETRFERNPETTEGFRLHLRWAAMQVSNGRAIADVVRRFDTDMGEFEHVSERRLREVIEEAARDLTAQIQEAWRRGTFGASLVELTLRGSLTLPAKEAFKEALRSQIREVREVKERRVASGSVTFEVDTSVGAAELASQLQSFQWAGLRARLVDSEGDQVVLQID